MAPFKRLWITLLTLAVTAALLLAPAASAFAQEPTDDHNVLDPSLGRRGVLYPEPGQIHPQGLALHPDGSIVLVGSIQNNGASDILTLRLMHNGRLDRDFGRSGYVITGFGDGDEWGVIPLIQPGRRILSIGWGIWAGAYGLALARHLPNGALDASLNGTGKLWIGVPIGRDFHVGGALIQPDGKILIAGGYTATENGRSYLTRLLVRYNASGTPDAGFGASGVVNHRFLESTAAFRVEDVALAQDGSIVTAGFTGQGDQQRWIVDVYGPDGSHRRSIALPLPDPACARAACPAYAGGVEVQPNGKIAIAGAFSQGGVRTFTVLRFNPDWSLDPAFGGDGQVTTVFAPRPGAARDGAFDLALLPNGKILVVGTSAGDIALARYNPDGSLDSRFNDTGTARTDLGGEDMGRTVRLDEDGKALVLGTQNNRTALLRYRAFNGGPDPHPDPDPSPSPTPPPVTSFRHRVVLPWAIR